LVTAAERYWEREEKGSRYAFTADGVADVWDLATGKRARRLADDSGRSATFTADGRVLLVGGTGKIPAEPGRPAVAFRGEIALLDPLAGRWLRSFTSPPTREGALFRFSRATILAPDGRTLYVSFNTGEIVGFEIASGEPRRTIPGHRGFVGSLSISSDGRRLLSGGGDGTALLWDLTLAGAAKLRKKPVAEADVEKLEKLWSTLAEPEAQSAFVAMVELAAVPERTVELLAQHLKPVRNGPSEADLNRIFAELDSPKFATRAKATKELDSFGESAVPAVRKRMASALSLELGQRARAFLDKFDPSEQSPARLSHIRGIELLEEINTPAARKLLAELAIGAADAPLTLDAAAALGRLKGR